MLVTPRHLFFPTTTDPRRFLHCTNFSRYPAIVVPQKRLLEPSSNTFASFAFACANRDFPIYDHLLVNCQLQAFPYFLAWHINEIICLSWLGSLLHITLLAHEHAFSSRDLNNVYYLMRPLTPSKDSLLSCSKFPFVICWILWIQALFAQDGSSRKIITY